MLQWASGQKIGDFSQGCIRFPGRARKTGPVTGISPAAQQLPRRSGHSRRFFDKACRNSFRILQCSPVTQEIKNQEESNTCLRKAVLDTRRDLLILCPENETVLLGVKGKLPLGANCGGCGHATCAEFTKAVRELQTDTDYPGPNCIFKISDLGIATGSAVKCAASHNVDNRVMYTAGVTARRLGMMDNCTIIYGIPLKVSGKDIFFGTEIQY